MKRARCFFFASLISATAVNGAFAYVLTAEEGNGAYWNAGDIPIRFKFGPSPTLQDGSTWNASAQAALAKWNEHMTVLRLVGEAVEGTTGGDHNGVNEAFFASDVYGRAFGPNVAAVTLIATGGIPRTNTEVEVVFNSALRWDSYRGPLQASLDFRRVALHEFGHVIGLGHPDEYSTTPPPAIMRSTTGTLEELTEDDIAGADFLYGKGEFPAFVEEPALNVVPSLGTDIYFTCSVRGSPPFRYEIFHNGVVMQNASLYPGLPRNTAIVHVAFNQPGDFGAYRIDLINRLGRASTRNYQFEPDSTATAPTIETGPSDLTLTQGEPGQLAVAASGNPSPTFIWYKDGRALSGYSGCLLPLQGGPSDAGVYQVTVLNTAGSTKSRLATVTVSSAADAPDGWCFLQPAIPNGSVNDITYAKNRFVAVGYEGFVATSPDGLRWAPHNLGADVHLSTVGFGAGRFVALGRYDPTSGQSYAYVSEEGERWAKVELDGAANLSIQGVAFGSGHFVAVDMYGKALISSDGLIWSLSPWQVPDGEYLDAIAFGNGRFVVSSRTQRVWTSADGLMWTEFDSGIPTGMNTIAFGNGIFVGAGRAAPGLSDKSIVGVSTDGVSWTSRPVQSVRGRPRVSFLNGRFHLMADSCHLISTNGREWEQRNFTTENAGVLAYGASRYVALNPFGQAFASRDGLQWITTGRASGPALRSVAFGNDRFMVFDKAQSSRDGVAWQPMPSPGSDIKAATYGDGLWVCVGRTIGRSVDGQTWATVVASPQASYASVAYGQGRFVAVGYRSWAQRGGVACSVDGSTWIESAPEGAPELRGVAYGAAGFVAVGKNGTILRSVDGVSWTRHDAGTTKELHGIVWDGTRYVAVGGDGYGVVRVVAPGTPIEPNATVCTSTDGIVWTATTLPFESVLCSVAVLDGVLLAGGTDGLVLYSKNGTASWQQGPTAPSELWRLAAGKGVFVATNNGSSLFRLAASALASRPKLDFPPLVYTSGPNTVVSLEVGSSPPALIKWWRDQTFVGQSSGTTWQSPSSSLPAGVYFAEFPNTSTPQPLVLAPATTQASDGHVTLVQSDIRHPNGNIFDQFLLTGPSARIRARADRISRVSFRDLNEDIVQVEFSGSGTLTILLQNASGPGKALNYDQDVQYMKGHARIYVSDADESSNVSVFSVGRITAVNPTLFRPDTQYDGIADIGLLAIHSRNGRFGGVRLGNASIWDRSDVTGLWAPQMRFVGPIILGDISAFESARPGLLIRAGSDVRIAGGKLAQDNRKQVEVDDTPLLQFTVGSDSHGRELPAQRNQARFAKENEDVTSLLVPTP